MAPLMSWNSIWLNLCQDKNLLYLINLRFKQLFPHCLASSIHLKHWWYISDLYLSVGFAGYINYTLLQTHPDLNSLISLSSVPIPGWLPVDTGRKLNVHKTFRRRPGRLLNVLCTFNLRPVSTGLFLLKGLSQYSCPSTTGTLVLICWQFAALRMIKIMRTGWCDLLRCL